MACFFFIFFHRSIIKYFVRDVVNRDSAGNSLTENLVRQRIQLLKAVWNDTSKYACQCSDKVTHALRCCRTFDDGSISTDEKCTCLDGETESFACCANGNNFIPEDTIGSVLFDEVPAEDVVAAIMEKIQPFVKSIMTDPDMLEAFTK